MKLVMAIVNTDDSGSVINNLTKNGFRVTKLATTGGFLLSGNTTILVGVEDDKVDSAIEMIKSCSHSRTQMMPSVADPSVGGYIPAPPIEVTVGGATIFVVDVDRFEKV